MASILTIAVTSEPEELRQLLEKLQPSNMAGAMKSIGEAGEGLARDAFQDAKDPHGQAWAPLKESTLEAFVGGSRKRRKAYGTKPLVRTSVLANSLNWRLVGSDGVAIGASQHYGKYHQGDPDHATKNIVPQRAFLPIPGRALPDAWRDELVDAVESYLGVS